MRIHLMGICGTGMGSLAGLLVQAGHKVQGSDEHVYPPMSTMLAGLGIDIKQGYRAENLVPAPELVIVGNVIGKANPEAQALLASGIEHISMPQALGRFFLSKKHSIVVAGTHGKTTTTAILASLLEHVGRDPSYLVGGVLQEGGRSYRLGAGPEFVIEGDEYETSFFDKGSKFLHYMPRTAIVTSVEYDHAEMFPSLDAVKDTFRKFIALIPQASEGGRLVVCADDPAAMQLGAACRGAIVPYGLSSGARVRGRAIESGPQGMRFEAFEEDRPLGLFQMQLTGDHNLRNALSVVAVALRLGLSPDAIRAGLAAFRGVKRRQEVRGVAGGVTVIDDFAHHPTAVRETIAAIRARYPSGRLWAVFEPRTNTTRRDVFQEEYGRAFVGADEVLLAPVDHPERAPEGRRFDPVRVVQDIRTSGGQATFAEGGVAEMVGAIADRARRGDVVLIMSNGSFGGIHDLLLSALSARAISPGQAPQTH